MPSLPFTLRQLEVFSSLSQTRSFRRTAEKLGISQASVSNQIKTLEDQLGVVLLDRKPGRRPMLTSQGLDFLDDVRVFNEAAEACAAHRRRGVDEEPRAVRYRVLIGQGMLDAYVRGKLDRFVAANPLVELEFESRPPSESLIRATEDAEVDFALIHQRADRPVPTNVRELAQVRGGVYGHRKFAEGRDLPLSAEWLSQLPFIMPKASDRQERDVLRTLEGVGIRPRHVVVHTQYYDVMAAMLERGLGVASFSDAVLPPGMRDEVILLYPLLNWRLLYYRKDNGEDPRCDAAEAFLLSSVLQDPDYPAIPTFVEGRARV